MKKIITYAVIVAFLFGGVSATAKWAHDKISTMIESTYNNI